MATTITIPEGKCLLPTGDLIPVTSINADKCIEKKIIQKLNLLHKNKKLNRLKLLYPNIVGSNLTYDVFLDENTHRYLFDSAFENVENGVINLRFDEEKILPLFIEKIKNKDATLMAILDKYNITYESDPKQLLDEIAEKIRTTQDINLAQAIMLYIVSLGESLSYDTAQQSSGTSSSSSTSPTKPKTLLPDVLNSFSNLLNGASNLFGTLKGNKSNTSSTTTSGGSSTTTSVGSNTTPIIITTNSNKPTEKDNSMVYIIVGVSVLMLSLIGYFVLKAKK